MYKYSHVPNHWSRMSLFPPNNNTLFDNPLLMFAESIILWNIDNTDHVRLWWDGIVSDETKTTELVKKTKAVI